MPDPTPDGFALQSQRSNHNAESPPPDTFGRVARSTDGEQAAVTTSRKRPRRETDAAETLTPDTLARAALASNQAPAVVTPPSPLPDTVGRAADSTDGEQAVVKISRKRRRSETEAEEALTPDGLARAVPSSIQEPADVASPSPMPDSVGRVARPTDGEQALTSPKRRRSETDAGAMLTPGVLARAAPSSNQEPAVVTAPRKRCRAGAHAAPSRSSRRLAGEKSSVEFTGGSIRDNSRIPSVSQGKRNPGSESSTYNLQRDQARGAQRRDEANGIYTGALASLRDGKVVVVAEFSGGWIRGKKIIPRNRDELVYHHPQTECELYSSKYDGTWEPGTPHGEGTIKYIAVAGYRFLDNDFTYSGGFREGKFHGTGTLSFPNGDVIRGSFCNHTLEHGRGTKTHADGSRYHGPFANGTGPGSINLDCVAHGIGTLDYKDEEGKEGRYEGSWNKGKRCGEGTEKYPDGSEYTGMFVDGVAHGQGTYSYAEGKGLYKGEHLYGVAYGRGTIKYANGYEYTGRFEEDRPECGYHGGTLKDCKGNVFKGSISRGRCHGMGVLRFKKEDGHVCQARYIAYFRCGAPSDYETFWDTKGVKREVCWACRCHTDVDDFGHYRQVINNFQEFFNSKLFSQVRSNCKTVE